MVIVVTMGAVLHTPTLTSAPEEEEAPLSQHCQDSGAGECSPRWCGPAVS